MSISNNRRANDGDTVIQTGTDAARIKHLTLLHSNDLHGDFLAERLDDKLVGGVALLSGYINEIRETSQNTLYMIAGDIFNGSLIDSEFRGISSFKIMDMLNPDVVTLGNHEMDYGIAHLLFLEKCCTFPIVNANIYIQETGRRVFKPCKIFNIDGMKILVIGIITPEIMAIRKKDLLLDTFVEINDAAEEIHKICSMKDVDIDLTIVLTHIGFENDIKLAELIDPECGVDLIIGGHSHTLPRQPYEANGILIVQAGIGTDQIGRFEIDIDTKTNSIAGYTWQTVEINEQNCRKNEAVEKLISHYKNVTDTKYSKILAKLPSRICHPYRYEETAVGNLFCDILLDCLDVDLVLIGSGSLRQPSLGAVVTKGDIMDMYPKDERLLRVILTGRELKNGIRRILNVAPLHGEEHQEYYQVSRGFRFVLDKKSGELLEASRDGEPIADADRFTVAIEGYHYDNLKEFLEIDPDLVNQRSEVRTIVPNIRIAVEEYLQDHTQFTTVTEGRTQIIR